MYFYSGKSSLAESLAFLFNPEAMFDVLRDEKDLIDQVDHKEFFTTDH